jgi:hypothetical protein
MLKLLVRSEHQASLPEVSKRGILLLELRAFYTRWVHILVTSTPRGVDEEDSGAEVRGEGWA